MVTTMLKLGMLDKLELNKLPNLLKKHCTFPPKNAFWPYWRIRPCLHSRYYWHSLQQEICQNDSNQLEWFVEIRIQGSCYFAQWLRKSFSVALKKNGFSNNTTNPDEIAKAFGELKALNTNVLAYDTENIKQKFIATRAWIGMMWSGDAAYCRRENPDIGFVIPDQGTLIWADTIAIPKGCKNKELAEKFINYMYDPKVSAKNFDYIALPNPNAAAIPLMNKAYSQDPILKLGNEGGKKGEERRPI